MSDAALVPARDVAPTKLYVRLAPSNGGLRIGSVHIDPACHYLKDKANCGHGETISIGMENAKHLRWCSYCCGTWKQGARKKPSADFVGFTAIETNARRSKLLQAVQPEAI